MSYASFVKDVFDCIKEHSGHGKAFTLSVFAEGPAALSHGHRGIQDYAILRGIYAESFFATLSSLKSDASGNCRCRLERSTIMPGQVKIKHSCYPRNLRRWMLGDTVSRKRECREEFCALTYCWAAYWLEEINQMTEKERVIQVLMDICRRYSESGISELDLLWNACEAAYKGDYKETDRSQAKQK